MVAAWLFRCGVDGSHSGLALSLNLALFPWRLHMGDVGGADRDELTRRLALAMPDREPAAIRQFNGQFYAPVHRMEPGDVVVTPRPGRQSLALGVVTGDYAYHRYLPAAGRQDLEWHVRQVRWLPVDVEREELTDDLRRTLRANTGVGEFKAPDAAARLLAISGVAESISTDGKPEVGNADDLARGRQSHLQAVTARQGQSAFRLALLAAYEGRCAVSGCDVEDALQAAHIDFYDGPATNHVTNGLILRADLHNLFDRGLLWIDEKCQVRLVERLLTTHYREFNLRPLRRPATIQEHPDIRALARHRRGLAQR